jgi:four helix bundle protein
LTVVLVLDLGNNIELGSMPSTCFSRPSAARHLDDASTSVALNIAEGNGKRSVPDRVRFLEIARGSALECAACLDVLVMRKKLDRVVADAGKAILIRIVSTVTKLIEKLLKPPSTSTSTSTSTTSSTK